MAIDTADLADRFLRAYDGTPIPLLHDDVRLATDEAYEVQARFVERFCRERSTDLAGYKVSVTNEAAQASIATDEPTYGSLTGVHLLRSPATIPLADLNRPLVEPELVFVLDEAIGEGATADEVRASARVAAGLELPDSRYQDWFPDPQLEVMDLVADNSVAGRVVYGEATVRASNVDLVAVAMEIRHDGTTLGASTGAAVLGDPVNSVLWLARKLARRGVRLEAGSVVSSGTFTAPYLAEAGTYEADFEGVGSVRVTFTP